MTPGRPAAPWRLLADVAVLAVLVVPLLVVARVPLKGPHVLALSLGPGDAPYIEGFSETSEIENSVGLHWAGTAALMRLPFEVKGPLRVRVRFARVLPRAADIVVQFAGAAVDRASCRGGQFVERGGATVAMDWRPAELVVRASDADERGRALRFDWARFELLEGAQLRLRGRALGRPALLVGVLFLVLRLAGFGSLAAAGLCLPWLSAGLVLLRHEPWLLHRFLGWVPETLVVLGLVLVAAGKLLEKRSWLHAGDTRLVVAVASAAFIVRAGALNHPDYWYPDLFSHARLIEIVRDAGLDFFRDPTPYIREQHVWVKEAYGRTYAMPYSPAFHVPFALLPLNRDDVLTYITLVAAAFSTVPMLALAVLARTLGASPAGVVLLALIPAYGMRLALAFVAAVFGSAVDASALAWFARRFRGLGKSRVFLAGAALTAACSLAYVSSVIALPVFLSLLAVGVVLERRPDSLRLGACILGAGALGSLLAFGLYYRAFSELIFDMAARLVSGETAGSARVVRGVGAVVRERTLVFFGPIVPLLAVLGLARLMRTPGNRVFVGAWGATYLALLAGRARFPDVFTHVHDVLFVAPLLCLAAGDVLAGLARRGLALRALAALLWLSIAGLGLFEQWKIFVAQFGFVQ